MDSNPKKFKCTETSFSILNQIKKQERATVTSLADALNRPKSTIHRHLNTLQEIGYVVESDNQYCLSLQFLDLAENARTHQPIYSVLKPDVDDLVEKTGERAQIMVEENNHGVYICQSGGQQAIKTDSHIGTQVYLHSVASGKAYLAALSDAQIEEILDDTGLPSITPHTITNREKLYEEINQIREQGYAFNDEEDMEGIRAVASAICHNNGTPIGSISLAGPKTRLQGDKYRKKYPEIVSDIATVLGIKVTYE